MEEIKIIEMDRISEVKKFIDKQLDELEKNSSNIIFFDIYIQNIQYNVKIATQIVYPLPNENMYTCSIIRIKHYPVKEKIATIYCQSKLKLSNSLRYQLLGMVEEL